MPRRFEETLVAGMDWEETSRLAVRGAAVVPQRQDARAKVPEGADGSRSRFHNSPNVIARR